jgi:hypothetical protein
MAFEEAPEKKFPIEWRSRKFLFTVLFVLIFILDKWIFKALVTADLAVLAGVLGIYNIAEGYVDGQRAFNGN